MTTHRPHIPSDGYKKLCQYVSDTPRCLSALYDLNLLPECCNTAAKRKLMIAFIMGYKVGTGEAEPS